jgi:hypothetical protein
MPSPTPHMDSQMINAKHRLLRRSALLPCLCAAQLLATAPVFAAKPDVPAFQSLLQASSPGSKVVCANDTYGNSACTIDGAAVDVNNDCTSNMAFGGVTDDKGATLEDNFKGASAKPIAHVGKHQLVCIQATQRKEGTLLRALVKVVPTKTVKECKGNDSCKGADTPVEWKRPPSGTVCTLRPDGHYAGDCATGWVDGKDIEEYSMGLNPEDTGA